MDSKPTCHCKNLSFVLKTFFEKWVMLYESSVKDVETMSLIACFYSYVTYFGHLSAWASVDLNIFARKFNPEYSLKSTFFCLKWIFWQCVRNRKYESLKTTSKNFSGSKVVYGSWVMTEVGALTDFGKILINVEQSCVSKNDVIIISGANQIQTVFEPM